MWNNELQVVQVRIARPTDQLDKVKEVLITRLTGTGYPVVEPENPYWAERGKMIEDPDGWQIVLINTKDI